MPGTRFRHLGMAAMTVDPRWTVAQTCVVLLGGNPTAVRERARARKVSAELVLYGCQRALDAQRCYGEDLAPFDSGMRRRRGVWTFACSTRTISGSTPCVHLI